MNLALVQDSVASPPDAEKPVHEWVQDHKASKETWNREDGAGGYCYIGKYIGSGGYNWQAWRGEIRLSGSADSREAAMQLADEMIALPVEEFNERGLIDLVDNLRRIEQKIARLSPTASILPGYHTGYEAGLAEAKRRIEQTLHDMP